MKEPFLEPLLRRMRLRQVLPNIQAYPDCHLLDVGCGWEAKLLRMVEPYVARGVGVDFKAPELKTAKLETVSVVFNERLPFASADFDVITMLAVLEHMDKPLEILRDCARLLRPGGTLLMTVPSWYAKPVLEFLSFRLGIVNPEEIRDHKRYFNREDLYEIFDQVEALAIVEHEYFQWRFNNRLVARKL